MPAQVHWEGLGFALNYERVLREEAQQTRRKKKTP